MKHGEIKEMSETQKAYIAGMMDADGCVGISKNKSRSNLYEFDFTKRAMITNCDYNLITWLHDVVGAGTAYQYKKSGSDNWRIVHRYQITGKKCRAFLKQILPYMIIKKDRAQLVMSLPVRGNNGQSGRTLKDYGLQDILFNEVKALNQRGVQDER